jgi:hypothetical protein
MSQAHSGAMLLEKDDDYHSINEEQISIGDHIGDPIGAESIKIENEVPVKHKEPIHMLEKATSSNLALAVSSFEEIPKSARAEICEDISKLTSMIGTKWTHGQPFMPWDIKSLDEKAI